MAAWKDSEDVRLNRVWLKITPVDADGAFDRLKASGDYQDLYNGVTGNSDFDQSFYLPISGELPSYAWEGTYDKQTPDWGMAGRQMADLMGGLAKSTGKILNSIGDMEATKGLTGGSVLGILGGYATGIGKFLHAFTGDIDSPKIWMGSSVNGFSVDSVVAFENEYEQNYYKVVELVLTAMTMPSVRSRINTVAQIAKMLNTSDGGPLKSYEVYLMSKPLSECDIEIIIGKQEKDLVSQYSVVKVVEDAKSRTLFALNDCYLSKFSVGMAVGDQGSSGFDERGIPRLVSYSLSIEPRSFNSVITGFNKILTRNKYTTLADATILPDKAPGSIQNPIESIPDGLHKGLTRAANQRMSGYYDLIYKSKPPIGLGQFDAPFIKRQVQFAAGSAARGLIHNILFGNISVAAVAYLGGVALNALSPVRVLVGAGGDQTLLPAGYAGYLVEEAVNISNVANLAR